MNALKDDCACHDIPTTDAATGSAFPCPMRMVRVGKFNSDFVAELTTRPLSNAADSKPSATSAKEWAHQTGRALDKCQSQVDKDSEQRGFRSTLGGTL